MQAILINAAKRTVEKLKVESQDEVAKLVGGFLAIAHRFGNGDLLLVDEQARFRDEINYGFCLDGSDRPFFIGNGLVVAQGVTSDDVADSKSQLSDVEDGVSWQKRQDPEQGGQWQRTK